MSFKIIIIIKYNNINVKGYEEINSSSLIKKEIMLFTLYIKKSNFISFCQYLS